MASMCPVDMGGIQDSRGMRPDSQDLMPYLASLSSVLQVRENCRAERFEVFF